ncbi:NYN domain-containing protein [Gemelliphila palaticanis]|uniref:NYN domain-containing protein n=1 Tax=Gemelliphila palaticanis TaxID=81950 RepID=A0ABX2SXW0_9BACL|nr:NYN domain-containing protein [Gemella palaticanis]MBF0715191.1 NYN domain-containing protein [Gemella palaticanis]NYS47121.1 NYN domain-containing protein [Gemella palaticanis]
MKKRYLIIDGYNLLFKMKEYNKIKSSSFAIERDILIDILKEYVSGNEFDKTYCVFDAYYNRNKEYIKEDHPIYIVYTKTDTTADQWIESKTRELYMEHFSDVIVVSDDRNERDSALGYGAILRDCHRFIKDLYDRKIQVKKEAKAHNNNRLINRNIRMTEETRKKLESFLLEGKSLK